VEKDNLGIWFKKFAENECAGSSPLYEFLSSKIAENDDMLAISSYALAGQPIPNLFLAAVHQLLLKGKGHALASFYPSLAEHPQDKSQSFQHFKEFCLTHREEIIKILQTRLVQTNEVGRCGYLYPCFSYIYEQTGKPLAIIEIGTSGGLQLLWDQYRYSYEGSQTYGNQASSIQITSICKGKNKPMIRLTSPPVTHRIGIDLHVNDLMNPEDYSWLQSLIWPEHHDRRAIFKQASQIVSEHQLDLIEGNGVELLVDSVSKIPESSTICVFHTHVANQIPKQEKHELEATIKQLGQSRDIYHLYNNMWDADLHLDSFINGVEKKRRVGMTDGHGKWFTWAL